MKDPSCVSIVKMETGSILVSQLAELQQGSDLAEITLARVKIVLGLELLLYLENTKTIQN